MTDTELVYPPLVFNAQIVRARRSKAETLQFVEEAPLQVASLRASDAPASLRLNGLAYPKARHVDIEFRSFGGRAYRPLQGPAGEPQVTIPMMAEALQALSRDPSAAKDWQDFPWGRDDVHLRMLMRGDALARQDVVISEWLSDDRADKLGRLRDVADELLVIDGAFWIVTPEPVLAVDPGQQPGGAFILPTCFRRPVPASERCAWFRADRPDAAIEFSRAMKLRAKPQPGVEILRPDLMTFDERWGAASRVAGLTRTSGVALWFTNLPGLSAPAATLSAILATHQPGSVFPGVEAMDAIRSLRAAIPNDVRSPSIEKYRTQIDEVILSEAHFAAVDAGAIGDLEALDLVL